MILARHTKTRKRVLLRCGCTHSWGNDRDKYNVSCSGYYTQDLCPICRNFGWPVPSLTIPQLIQRDRITL